MPRPHESGYRAIGLNGPTLLRVCMCFWVCVTDGQTVREGKKQIFAYIIKVAAHFFFRRFKSGSRCFKWDCQGTHLAGAGCHAAVKSFHSQPGATTAHCV